MKTPLSFSLVKILTELLCWTCISHGQMLPVCPATILELDNLFQTENMIVSNLVYNVHVQPSPQPTVGIDSRCNIQFTLSRVTNVSTNINSAVVSQTCNILVPSYKAYWENIWLSLTRSENTSSAGVFSFETLSNGHGWRSNSFQILGVIPIGDGILPKTRGVYKLSVARPSQENCTVVSNMPLETTRQFSTGNQENMTWYIFQPTIPIYPNQLSVSVFVGNDTKTLEQMDEENNRTISVTWKERKWILDFEPELENQGMECVLKWATTLLSFYETKLGVKYPLPNLYIVRHTNFLRSSKEALPATVGITTHDTTIHWPKAITANNSSNCQTNNEPFKALVQQIAQQWTGFLVDGSLKLSKLHKKFILDKVARWAVQKFDKKFDIADFYSETRSFDHFNKVYKAKAHVYFETLESIVGEAVVEAGIVNFFSKLSISSEPLVVDAVFDEIIKSIDFHNKTGLLPVKVSVQQLLHGWFAIVGYPVVRASISAENPQKLYVSQQPNYPVYVTDDTDITGWNKDFWFPVEIVTQSEKQFVWLSANKTNATVFLKSLYDSVVLINPKVKGFFKIVYDDTLTERISAQLVRNHTVIPWRLRQQLIQDYYSLSTDNFTSLAMAFELIKYMGQEDEVGVWKVLTDTDSKNGMSPLHLPTVLHRGTHRYWSTLVDSALSRISQSIEKYKALEKVLIDFCMANQTPGCILRSKQWIKKWMQNPEQKPKLKKYFPKFDDSVGELPQCLALRGTAPGDSSGIFDFILNVTNTNSDFLCGTHQIISSNVACTGNPTVVMPCIEEILNQDLLASWPLSITLDKVLTFQVNLVRPIYELLKSKLESGTIKTHKFVWFIEKIGHQRVESGYPELTQDLEQFAFECMLDENPHLDQVSINKILNLVENLKKEKNYIMSDRTQSGFNWLKKNGYWNT